MKIFEVNNDALESQFLSLPLKLHGKNPNRSVQLGKDVAHIFDERKNSLLRTGDAARWILLNDYNMPAGRIAAFYNHSGGNKTGGMGFFECQDSSEAAQLLFETATCWLRRRGCKKAEGPVNFGEKDRFWGLLTGGFDSPSLYLDNFNPPCYESFFRNFHFNETEEIHTYKVLMSEVPVERIKAVAERLTSRAQICFSHVHLTDEEKSAEEIHAVYSSSFDESKRMKHLSKDDIRELIRLNKNVLEEKLIPVAYHGETPVALLGAMKDLNQSLVNPTRKPDEIFLKGFAFAVIPRFREQGIELGLCYELYRSLKADGKNYQLFFSGVNKNSYRMISFLKTLNAKLYKIHKTFSLTLE
ncbi:MAG TPA: hypothetical protein VE978_14955 [Chitinophagales bacterium]|nr:hypothetical protein [Chitinophagales bacterium]